MGHGVVTVCCDDALDQRAGGYRPRTPDPCVELDRRVAFYCLPWVSLQAGATRDTDGDEMISATVDLSTRQVTIL